MKTRNLLRLTETKEFKELIEMYPITFYIKDGNILLKSNDVYIYIYSYVVESHPYFTFFNKIDLTYCFDLELLMSDIAKNSILNIYNYYETTHLKSIINENISGEIKMESLFLARIEVLKKHFSDLFNGEIKKYNKHFQPMIRGYLDMYNDFKTYL